MTPEQLLNLKLSGNSTLRDVLQSHQNEDQFGNKPTEMDEQEAEDFFLQLAQKIIDTVLKDVK